MAALPFSGARPAARRRKVTRAARRQELAVKRPLCVKPFLPPRLPDKLDLYFAQSGGWRGP